MDDNEKYPEGLIITVNGVKGTVVPNFKLPGDICVKWETGLTTSYDEDFLDMVVTNREKPSGD